METVHRRLSTFCSPHLFHSLSSHPLSTPTFFFFFTLVGNHRLSNHLLLTSSIPSHRTFHHLPNCCQIPRSNVMKVQFIFSFMLLISALVVKGQLFIQSAGDETLTAGESPARQLGNTYLFVSMSTQMAWLSDVIRLSRQLRGQHFSSMEIGFTWSFMYRFSLGEMPGVWRGHGNIRSKLSL